jgi:Transglycosylase SLT domain
VTISVDESKFLWAIRQQESGGNYSATNPSGATGAYQVLASNLSSWESKAGLPQENASQFLADKTEQDNLAIAILGGYYQKYGDRGAAAMWYSGQPDPTKSYGNPPVSKYVSDVVALESQAPANGIGSVGSSGTSSAPATGTSGSATQAAAIDPLQTLLSALGMTDMKDVLERGALILLGAVFIVVAFIKFTDTGQAMTSRAKSAAKVATVA